MKNENVKKILVIFKSHLDLGFTDFAENVYKKYMTEYIPAALKTAKTLREENSKARFCWTAGSWLINEYIKNLNEDEMLEFHSAVKCGDISWHGLPFTTHTELMDKELFKYGQSISKKLDKIFDVTTIAAKMTDVPGHTKAIIPLLEEDGIKLLHIGVNPASAVPDVPEIFIWKAEDGSKITIMYNADYGVKTPISNDTLLYFAHAGDNLSPPTPEDIKGLFKELSKEYPYAEIKASNLNEVAEIVSLNSEKLPIIDKEIGDTWIYGTGTDPKKVAQYRALLRLRTEENDAELSKIINEGLLTVPEHTWGLNENVHLVETESFIKEDFIKAKKTNPNFAKMEKSWDEQRNYITNTFNKFPAKYAEKAFKVTEEYKRESFITKDMEKAADMLAEYKLGDYTISFNNYGAICKLIKNGVTYSDQNNTLGLINYTQFGPEDYKRYFKQYIRSDLQWAKDDNYKYGMEKVVKQRIDFSPNLTALYIGADHIVAVINFDKAATEKFGCPEKFETAVYLSSENKLIIDIAWFNKPENRNAEATYVAFSPIAKNLRISKVGSFINPDTVNKGSRRLHATDWGIKYDNLSINSVDSALLSLEKLGILDFNDTPIKNNTCNFVLHDNVWGTNFPMWYGENARFRFILNC